MYQLKSPIKTRVNNEDTVITELPIPELITVGMMRRVMGGNEIMIAIETTVSCANLSKFEAEKLQSYDAIGYTNLLGDLVEPNLESTFTLPEIKPVKAQIAKITANMNQRVEFACQALEVSGMSRDKLNAMDVRDLLPRIDDIMAVFMSPK